MFKYASSVKNLLNLLRQFMKVDKKLIKKAKTCCLSDTDAACKNLVKNSLGNIAIEQTVSVVPVTVMFVDLRDFTGLVEEYSPSQVIRQLNEYFSKMTRIIVEHDGILDKYMGDEIMAYFECQNPLEYTRVACKAISAGIKMISALEELNKTWKQKGWPELKCGIGINSGPVLKGNIGSMVKLETTIIGDTVNVASRLQQLNKDYDAQMMISANTYKLVQGEFPLCSLGDISIRGRRQSIVVYSLDLCAAQLQQEEECDYHLNDLHQASL